MCSSSAKMDPMLPSETVEAVAMLAVTSLAEIRQLELAAKRSDPTSKSLASGLRRT